MRHPLRRPALGLIAMLSLVPCGSTLAPRTASTQRIEVQTTTGGGTPTTGALPTGTATTTSLTPTGRHTTISVLPTGGAATTPATLTRSTFVNATQSVGSSYHSDQTFGVDTAYRSDGVDTIRMGAYNEGCKCFEYTSGTQSIG
jgi:hypothetical protein